MGVLKDVGVEYGPEVVAFIRSFAVQKLTVTYKEINEFIKSKRGTGFANTDIGAFIGEIQTSLSQVNQDWPFINLVVVNQKGIVGKGAEWHVRQRHPRLQFGSQRYNEAIEIEQAEVFEWQDWDSIIECLEGLKRLHRMGKATSVDESDDHDEDAGESSSDYGSDQRTKIWAAIVARQGQGRFRNNLMAAYEGKCAISGCDFRQVLEACHIAPYLGTHTNELENGILLRADLHTLFDRGELGIDPGSNKVVISAGLKDSVYRELMGKAVFMPAEKAAQPSKELLARHLTLAGLMP